MLEDLGDLRQYVVKSSLSSESVQALSAGAARVRSSLGLEPPD
jgi:hypothetical protein